MNAVAPDSSGPETGTARSSAAGDSAAAVDPRPVRGARGESLAARWYESRGYDVLERNWRCPDGELDLILRHGATLVFSEVKVRSSDRFGTGAEAVSASKQRRIRRLATRWLAEGNAPRRRSGSQDVPERGSMGPGRDEFRFDVVSITGGQIEVIQDAF